MSLFLIREMLSLKKMSIVDIKRLKEWIDVQELSNSSSKNWRFVIERNIANENFRLMDRLNAISIVFLK